MIELFKKTKDGIRYWSIDIEYASQELVIDYGWINGSMQTQVESVEINESGRDIDEQLELRRDSRVSSKIDSGYRQTKEEAIADAGKNALGFYRPMLAKRFDQVRGINWENMWCQNKYDGHRCLMRQTHDGIVAYSRQGKVITTIDHITKSMQLPFGVTLDGELYCHGQSLQRISSWAKRKQPGTLNLEYVVYDIVSTTEPYHERYNRIKTMQLGDSARLAPTDKVIQESYIHSILDASRLAGYEGLILRDKNSFYDIGLRSKGLVKVKKFDDDEFKVVDVTASADGWGILICHTRRMHEFRVSAPGAISNKIRILKEKDKYIGKTVTVEYANITADGVPFHPVALRFREDI